MDNPTPVVGPAVINLGAGGPPPIPRRKFFGPKTFFIFGGLLLLLAGLGVGTFLVQRQQSQNPQSRADNFCSNARWPADPGTACGKATQKPAEGATDVSLTPDFHWDYGGYRPGETGCVEPSGCSSYGVAVYLAEGSYTDSNIIATCNMPTGSAPIKDAPWSCFSHGPLKPNTDYYWVPTPYYGGIVHAEMNWRYHFKTSSGVVPSATCQKVFADKDLATLKLNDTVTFTGYGVTSAETEMIDKIEFTLSGAATVSTESAAVRDTTKDSEFGGIAWKSTYTLKVTNYGSYTVRIRVHWKNQDVWKE